MTDQGGGCMRRREFITLLGGLALAGPRPIAAQPASMPVVGLLSVGSGVHLLDALRRGLLEAAFIDGRNVMIEHRSTEGRNEGFNEIAADLVRRRVAVICTTNNTAALAVKAATFFVRK